MEKSIKNTGEPIDLANISDYYGHDVSYNNKTYQLFYVDREGKYGKEGNVWLKSKEYINNVKLSDYAYEYETLLDESSVFWQINPDYNSNFGNEIRATDTSRIPMLLTQIASFCNPINWNDTYITSEDAELGAYAIGAASIEMYCDSYNQVRKITDSTASNYFSAKSFYDYDSEYGSYKYGYKVKPAYIDSSLNGEGYSMIGDYMN